MSEKYYWSKEVFKKQLEILHGQEPVGAITWESLWGVKAHGAIKSHHYLIECNILHSKLNIYDEKGETLLGSISINLFSPKSEIIINGKRFELEIKNYWQSRWAWKFNGIELISYQNSEFLLRNKGEIEIFTACTDETEILLLAGLFVRNQFKLFALLIIILSLILIF